MKKIFEEGVRLVIISTDLSELSLLGSKNLASK